MSASTVIVPVVSGLTSMSRSPTLLPAGRQSFDSMPKSEPTPSAFWNRSLMPPTSHAAPGLVPPRHVPSLTPSFGVGSPTHGGHGMSASGATKTRDESLMLASAQPVPER